MGSEEILQLNYSGIKNLSDDDLEKERYKKAKCLYLKRNLLKTLPSAIGLLKSLVQLHIVGNELECLPPEIGELTTLETLDVAGNKIGRLPSDIGRLKSLTKLCISDNGLRHIPADIGCLQKLTTLEASRNQLTSVPVELSRCQELTLLALDKNKLTCIPRQLCRLKKLTELSLCGNFLEYIPQAMVTMKSLKVLYLDNNPALSALPQSIDRLTRYCETGLHGCYQSDAVGCERFLHLYVNKIHVTIPEEIAQVCVQGVSCVPCLQELAMRTVSSSVQSDKDIDQLPLPVDLKDSLYDPTATCENCCLHLHMSVFPAVFSHYLNNTYLLGLFCSLKCRNRFFNGHKMLYPCKKEIHPAYIFG